MLNFKLNPLKAKSSSKYLLCRVEVTERNEREIWRSFGQTWIELENGNFKNPERKLMKNVNYPRFPHFPFAPLPFHRLHPAFVAMTTLCMMKKHFFCLPVHRRSSVKKHFNPFFVLACVFQSSWLCFCFLLRRTRRSSKKTCEKFSSRMIWI